jgi:hypothetical protein
VVHLSEEATMKTPKEKYMNDPEYNHLVSVLEDLIERARFTPSELREACMLASINYEMRHIRSREIDPRAEEAMRFLEDYVNRPSSGGHR